MRVQRVLLPGSGVESWTLLCDDLVPVEPVERFLAYLASIERSPNMVRAYAHDLKDWFTFLGGRRLDWHAVTLEDVAAFVAWLRLPPAVAGSSDWWRRACPGAALAAPVGAATAESPAPPATMPSGRATRAHSALDGLRQGLPVRASGVVHVAAGAVALGAGHAVRAEAGVVSMRFGLTDREPKTLDVIGKVYVDERHLVAVMGEYTRHYNTHRRSAVGSTTTGSAAGARRVARPTDAAQEGSRRVDQRYDLVALRSGGFRHPQRDDLNGGHLRHYAAT